MIYLLAHFAIPHCFICPEVLLEPETEFVIEDVIEERLPKSGRLYKRIVLDVQKRKVPILAAAVKMFEKKCQERAKRVNENEDCEIVVTGPEQGGDISGNMNQVQVQQAQAPFSSFSTPTTVTLGNAFQSESSQRETILETGTSERGEVNTSIVHQMDQRGMLGTVRSPKPSKEQNIIKK